MNETEKTEELKAASANLSYYLDSAILIVNWNSMDQQEIEDEQDGPVKLQKIEAAHNRFAIQVRDRFPKTVDLINSSIHRFAAVSDLYTIDIDFSDPEEYIPESVYEEPDVIIGTSAHQAGVLFLQRCIESDFWKGSEFILDKWHTDFFPKLKQKQFQARMHWERLRVFESSVFRQNHAYEDLAELIADEDSKSKTKAEIPYHHDATEEVPPVFLDFNTRPIGRLRGNLKDLAAALDVTENTFKAWGRNRSIWIIRHSRFDYELIIHKDNQMEVDEYKNKLAKIQQSKQS